MMDNNALLLLMGAKNSKQTIGKAGQQGFGVGVYGGDPSDLTAMGLSPMQGCEEFVFHYKLMKGVLYVS